MTGTPQPAPFDYNDEVFRHGVEGEGLDYSILRAEFNDVHPLVADRLASYGEAPVLDMGCGPMKLGKLLDERGVAWVGVDAAMKRLVLGTGPRMRGDARWLPFADGAFGAVAALYMLYHFEDPMEPIREAYRVLRPGGLFCACAPAADDDPELAGLLPSRPQETFDSDMAPALIGELFEVVRIDRWDMALYRLPDERALWTYLVARGTPPDLASTAAAKAEYPLWLTKRGAVVWGRKG